MSPLKTKAQSLKFESKIPWSIARRPKKPKKSQEDHLEEGRTQKPTKGTKSGKANQNGKEELRKTPKSKKRSKSTQKLKRGRKAQNQHKSSKSTLPPWNQLSQILSMQALPFRWSFIIFLLSSTLLAKSSINFVPILSPFGNEPIKHKPREEWDAMHENQH
jgi:hypothetical protein